MRRLPSHPYSGGRLHTARSHGLRERLQWIRTPRQLRSSGLALTAGIVLALGGCTSFSPDAGLSVARDYAGDELKKDIVKITDEGVALTAQARVEQLLRRPLTPDSAVQIALLKNRGLQAAFSDLGVSEAQYVQATLPPVPRFTLTYTSSILALEAERQIVLSLIQLATLPLRIAVAENRFQAAQYRAAEAVLRLAAEARRQYFRTISANQTTAYLQQALGTAESASTLAKQLGETGALNKLEQAREHAFYTELGVQLAKARVQQKVEREKLVRQLGLWGREIDFRLPNSLPPLPGHLISSTSLEAEALQKRVDLQIAKYNLQALAQQYGLTSTTGFINVLDFGFAQSIEKSTTIQPNAEGGLDISKETTPRPRGFNLDVSIPIYDFGTTAVRGAQEAYLGAAHRLAERAVNARSEVREAFLRYRGQYDITRYFQKSVLPLRKTIQDQALLQYSGMLVDVTTLIIDARSRILSNIQAIEAQRDFWIATTDLKAAIIGGGFGGAEGGSPGAVPGGEAAGGESGAANAGNIAAATPGG